MELVYSQFGTGSEMVFSCGNLTKFSRFWEDFGGISLSPLWQQYVSAKNFVAGEEVAKVVFVLIPNITYYW